MVENTKTETLIPIIVRKIKPGSWVYTDTYRSYDAFDVSKFHHERINQSFRTICGETKPHKWNRKSLDSGEDNPPKI